VTSAAARRSTARSAPRPDPAARLRLVPTQRMAPARAPFVALVVAMLSAGLLGLLMLNTLVAQNSFTLQKLRQNNTALQIKEQTLQGQVDADEAPGMLAARASRLGMVPAGTPAFIRLPDGKVLGVPRPAVKPPVLRFRSRAKATPAPPAATRTPAPPASTATPRNGR
jgi:hypothetical protein